MEESPLSKTMITYTCLIWSSYGFFSFSTLLLLDPSLPILDLLQCFEKVQFFSLTLDGSLFIFLRLYSNHLLHTLGGHWWFCFKAIISTQIQCHIIVTVIGLEGGEASGTLSPEVMGVGLSAIRTVKGTCCVEALLLLYYINSLSNTRASPGKCCQVEKVHFPCCFRISHCHGYFMGHIEGYWHLYCKRADQIIA